MRTDPSTYRRRSLQYIGSLGPPESLHSEWMPCVLLINLSLNPSSDSSSVNARRDGLWRKIHIHPIIRSGPRVVVRWWWVVCGTNRNARRGLRLLPWISAKMYDYNEFLLPFLIPRRLLFLHRWCSLVLGDTFNKKPDCSTTTKYAGKERKHTRFCVDWQ